jgi:hypothetical protein
MLTRLAQFVLWLAIGVVGLLLLLAVAYFARGSLEQFPTAEQVAKVRVVTATSAAVLLGVEVGLWWLLRHVVRTSGRPRGGVVPPAA